MGSQHLINERTGRRDDFLLVFFYAQARMWKFAANAAWGRAESGGEGHSLLDCPDPCKGNTFSAELLSFTCLFEIVQHGIGDK